MFPGGLEKGIVTDICLVGTQTKCRYEASLRKRMYWGLNAGQFLELS